MDTLVDSLSLHVDLNVEKTRNGSMVQFQQGTFVASHTSLFPLVSSLKMQKHLTLSERIRKNIFKRQQYKWLCLQCAILNFSILHFFFLLLRQHKFII